MIDEPLRSSIAALLRLADGASPLPWDDSQWYSLAYVKDGTNPDWDAPDKIKPGQCTYCVDHPETYVKTVTGNMGRNLHMHVFPLDSATDTLRRVFSTVTGQQVINENEGEISRADSAYITAAANLAPQLARLVLQLEQELEAATVQAAGAEIGTSNSVKFQPAPCIVFDPYKPAPLFTVLAPDQESRLADAVAERVLRGMGREMQK
jgi:hypothetical protein